MAAWARENASSYAKTALSGFIGIEFSSPELDFVLPRTTTLNEDYTTFFNPGPQWCTAAQSDVVVYTSALCRTYAVSIETSPEDLHPSFVQAVEQLATATKRDIGQYTAFVNAYGAVYATAVDLGRLAADAQVFNASSWEALGANPNVTDLWGALTLGFYADVGAAVSESDPDYWGYVAANASRASNSTGGLGGFPPACGGTRCQDQSSLLAASLVRSGLPVPVRYTMQPVASLLTAANFPQLNETVLRRVKRDLQFAVTNGTTCAPPQVPDAGCAAPPAQPLPATCCNASAALAAVIQGGGAAVELNASALALASFATACEELRACGGVLGADGVPLALSTACQAAAQLRRGVDMTAYNLSSVLMPQTFATYQQARPQIEADTKTTEDAVTSLQQAGSNVSLATPVVTASLAAFQTNLQPKWRLRAGKWEAARASAADDVVMLGREVALQVARLAGMTKPTPLTPGALLAAGLQQRATELCQATAAAPAQNASSFPTWWAVQVQPALQAIAGLELVLAAGAMGRFSGELAHEVQTAMDGAESAGGALTVALDSLCAVSPATCATAPAAQAQVRLLAGAVNATRPTIDALAQEAPALAQGGAGLPLEAQVTPLLQTMRLPQWTDAVQAATLQLVAAAASGDAEPLGQDTMATYAGTDLANATTGWLAAQLDFQLAAGVAQYHSQAVAVAGAALGTAQQQLQALPGNATNVTVPASTFYDAFLAAGTAVAALRQTGSGVLLRDLYGEVAEFETLSLAPFAQPFPALPYSQTVAALAETLSQDEQSQLGQFSGQTMWTMLEVPMAAEPERFQQLNETGSALFNLPVPPPAASDTSAVGNGTTGFSGVRLLWAQAYLVGAGNISKLAGADGDPSAPASMVTVQLRQLGRSSIYGQPAGGSPTPRFDYSHRAVTETFAYETTPCLQPAGMPSCVFPDAGCQATASNPSPYGHFNVTVEGSGRQGGYLGSISSGNWSMRFIFYVFYLPSQQQGQAFDPRDARAVGSGLRGTPSCRQEGAPIFGRGVSRLDNSPFTTLWSKTGPIYQQVVPLDPTQCGCTGCPGCPCGKDPSKLPQRALNL